MTQISQKPTLENNSASGEKVTDVSSAGLDNLKISETVSNAVSENIPTDIKKKSASDDKKKTNTSIFNGISDKIYGILGSRTAKNVILPSITIQKKRVKKSLEREKSKLMSQANKIRNAKRFKASALEETIAKIRYIQQMIDDMFNLASKKITELYKKYYLNLG